MTFMDLVATIMIVSMITGFLILCRGRFKNPFDGEDGYDITGY